ncbi:UDP-Glycosyltransferase/glycogen phosphorylase [Byssothecium circinans]|uniref:UDP-Glycosyltransferase/glycogen phosphorylase n=1 Tax=Byssothecium circinans TaxID=147558 RepID=A0A6A5TPP5_9PLEO|nr:UDP-Glycosyltransferase/glycogen phosphorylase [Byssothecium circinans]
MPAPQTPADAQNNSVPPPQSQSREHNEPRPHSDGVAAESPVVESSRQQQEETSEPPRAKPEGSGYTSSYRSSDVQNLPPISTPDEHFGLTGHIDDATAPPRDQPPPAYTEMPGVIEDDNDTLGAAASVAADGRVNINISQRDRKISQIIVPQLQRQLTQVQREPAPPPPYIPEFLGGAPGQDPPPALNVVIQVVGSRGDVQPFVALGKVLKETYGHRVRLATHPTFKDFVSENGLDFFSIGGDPAELMAFMVKNPGLMPGFDTLRSGEVGKRRKGIAEMLRGTWRSCIETGDGLGVDPLKQTVEEWMGVEEHLPEELKKPFVADAIIANPPSFGHIHCAEKLGIPLHMMFTMPWSPTQQFSHPLANIQSSNTDPTVSNFMSYILVDMLTWQGLGDVTNRFRKDCLGLDPISMIWAPAMLARLKVPWTYCWSPALIPKPKDWGHHIQISGFYFLNLASNYTPAPDLAAFLEAGEPPVYIGFGSIVVDDPNAMTDLIFRAVKITGRRALVSKGWGGLGGDDLNVPEGVFMLGNVPHDWLFKHVAAVVHHGGAGTTAAGIAAGRPTVVVPFFGDQPFWGAMTARAGAGPEPVAYKDLTAEKLAESINQALKPESLDRAKELFEKITREQGSQNGAQSFHQMLKYDDLRCAAAPKHPAAWRVKRTQVRLSAKAATVLAQEGELNFSELKLFRPREYVTDEGPWDPFSGAASALLGTATQMMMGVADFPIETLKLLNIHPETKKKNKGKGNGNAKESENDSASGSTRTELPSEMRPRNDTQESAASSATSQAGVFTPDNSISRSRPSHDLPEVVTVSPEPTTPIHRSTFMAQAMAASSKVSRSPSPSRHRRLLSTEGSHCRRLSGSRARSISGAESRPSPNLTPSERTFSEKFTDMNADSMVGTGKGVGRIIGAGFKSPLDFSLNIARGFHNVPKLYGGEVRQVDKVTDFESGMKTAAKEFGLGLYEGIAGIVTDPYKGAKQEGAVGFVKGVGRGIVSVPFRVMAGAWSVPAYAMKGLYQEMMKEKGANAQNYIIAARISQGYDEASTISAAERADIISRWKCIKLNVKKKKNPGEEQLESLHNFMEQRRNKRKERPEKPQGRFKRNESTPNVPPASKNLSQSSFATLEDSLSQNGSRDTGFGAVESGRPFHHGSTYPVPAPSQAQIARLSADQEKAELRQLEEAIQGSVAETSRGNHEEDELIARAIRASMAELEREPAEDEDEEQVLERVMTASLQEAQRAGATEEEQQALEETLRQSLVHTSGRRHHNTDSEWDSDESEEDEVYQRIIAESQKFAELHQTSSRDQYFSTIPGAQESIDAKEEEQLKLALQQSEQAHKEAQKTPNEEEELLRKALEESEQLHKTQTEGRGTGEEDEEEALRKVMEESALAEKERLSTLEKQRAEEDIVLEYVKKQSLAEEEHRRRTLGGRETGGESSRSGGGAGGSSMD